MTYEWPGTEAEKKVARILVEQTGGHFVSIVTVNGGSRVVGTERLGVKVGKQIIAEAVMAERERCTDALSAAEPVAWMDNGDTRNGSTSTSFRVVTAETKAAMPKASADNFNTPLYAAPPAPPVAVKAFETSKEMLTAFGAENIRKESRMCFKANGEDAWEDYYEVPFHALDRIRSALSAHVQDAEEQRTETCDRCQGNGEIVTDWERYRHPHENDVGDEAVAECPDCDGIGKVSAQVQDVAGWQLVPAQPTEEMLDAYWGQTGESEAMRSRVHGRAKILYHVMLAAAPAKKEG
ncbi:hypothetical protein [Agrobacterium pusense]|uniref:hypothetical protein n=1 Tax=Agrobacterium pusense TaxID=648995 RepID=UPI0010AE65EF|nr:hypothetical protein [Agrobacterium pusense]WCK26592.1 hypothetical protein CFBP5496_0020545 [Agrobacterium pusense]